MLYFQATITIIMHIGSNSKHDTEDVRSRKVYIHDTARKSKVQGILSVLPAVTRPVQTACRVGQCTIYPKTAR